MSRESEFRELRDKIRDFGPTSGQAAMLIRALTHYVLINEAQRDK